MLYQSPLFIIKSLVLIILLSEMPFAVAVPRTALVIGNGKYSFSPLSNPENDAKDMSRTLRDLGFEVAEHTDLDRVEMRKVIREFGEKLKKGGVGLFFYAGHGIQIKGRNYLIPVSSDMASADEVEDESIDANLVLRKMETAGNDFNIVILDACRNNPFASKFRSIRVVQGLARMEGPVGSIVAYSTAPGSTAADSGGNEENGLYTSYLLKAMKEPGLSIEDVFKKVRNAVRAETNGKQIPWESSSLTGNFEFNERTGTSSTAIIPPPPSPTVLSKLSHLQITANVPKGKVFVDGLEKGWVGDNLVLNLQNLETRGVTVRIERKGYQSIEKKVNLVAREWRLIHFELIPTKQNNSQLTSNVSTIRSKEEEKPGVSSNNSNQNAAKILSGKPKQSIKSMEFSFGRKKTTSNIKNVDVFQKAD